ncbi:MAG: redoxin domain-containing protein [Planctomycetota bacterium]|nr:redoxin domain-containing protein [Planctomycetota bacterium]
MKFAVGSTLFSRLVSRVLLLGAWSLAVLVPEGPVLLAQDAKKPAKAGEEKAKSEAEKALPAGHSNHGEAFNEGPRQKAYLMGNTGNVTFPATCAKPIVQKFINQGVGQLHGFWFFEAERSFRQAAAIDPACATAYWGMAMANINNDKRAKGFIAKAVALKDKVTERERMYIEAVDAYVKAGSKKNKDRSRAYAKALERISYKFPEDIESKAFLGLQLWGNRRRGLPLDSYLAVNALLEQVLAKNPMHPCHHFRIHLWDYEKAENALNSAARCGQAAPGIAHMWHMPGHIYSKLKRYEDACFQQEASARVDHAHMMRDRVLPDQIHNFAHNNEWLCRNLLYVGRVSDALSLAKNMLELPRHPKYNTIKRSGSTRYGRMRLLQVLNTYQLWDETIALAATPYLEPTTDFNEQIKRSRQLGRAYFGSGKDKQGRELLASLEKQLADQRAGQEKAGAAARLKLTGGTPADAKKPDAKKPDAKKPEAKKPDAKKPEAKKPEAKKADGKKPKGKKSPAKKKVDKKAVKKAVDAARKPFDSKIRTLEKAVQELQAHVVLAEGSEEKAKEALALFKKAGGMDASFLAFVQLATGDGDGAEKALRDQVKRRVNEVQPHAHLVELLWKRGRKKQAVEELKSLRKLSGSIDLTAPVFGRLAPVAKKADLPKDWRLEAVVRDDTGDRPKLDDLGPFRWKPQVAADWSLPADGGRNVSLKDYRGKPVVVIFYLGYGCLHCVEQLQAFAPKAEAFRKAGIELVAISSDSQEDLAKSIEKFNKEGQFPFPLAADPKFEIFKKYRCFDDFENLTLHGTFLIDGDGLVRWQDISYDPFMDAEFLLKESQRLLGQTARRQVAGGGE